jgi:NAD(P)-dependent dehydrogenase (short-subunit alcohol dehydrogenase family)
VRSLWHLFISGTDQQIFLGPYSSSKAAIHGIIFNLILSDTRTQFYVFLALTEILSVELAQFGIRTLLVAPGSFKTENIYGKKYHTINPIPAYNELRTASEKRFYSIPGTQKGDPDKAMEIVVDIVRGEGVARGREWPGMIILGEDAERELVAKYTRVIALAEEWKDISRSCNFD